MSRSKEMDLTTGNPFWSLLKFAIPVILGNLFQLFYTLADSVIVGKTLGADSLAAVGSTSIIIYFVFCFINGFTGGFGICLGQKCGAKDENGMRKSVAVSTLLSIAFTVVLTLICCLLSHQILRWMQIPADISGEAYDYMFVVLLGTGATVFYNMISNMLRALGDSKTPLYFLVFSSVLNIFLDILFIVPFHMGVAGVALTTIISQAISAVLVLLCLIKTEGPCHLDLHHLKFHGKVLTAMLRIGLPAGLQGAIFSISNVLIQSSVNSFGSTAMAGYTAANNILGFLYASINAVTQACMSFTSQNYGVNKPKRMDRVMMDCVILSVGVSLVFGCGAYAFGGEILKIYTTDPEVIGCGMEILALTTVTYFLCGVMDLFPGALRGMGASAVPMILSIIGTVGTRIVWIFGIFPSHRSLKILFVSYPASWMLTILMQAVCFYFVRKKVHRELKQQTVFENDK